MQKQQLESRAPEEHPPPTANVSDLVNCNVSSSGIKRFIKRESPLLASEDNNGVAPVRINRAARLRAAATSATPPPVEDKSGIIFFAPDFGLIELSKLIDLNFLDLEQFRESKDCRFPCWKCRPSIRQTARLAL